MTNHTAKPAADKGLSDHLDDMQRKAMLMESMVETVIACLHGGRSDELVHSLLEDARRVAAELCSGLDSVSLHRKTESHG